MFAPEDLPASDASSVGTEKLGKLTDSPRRGPLPHGSHQDDHRTEINLGPKETYRRWRYPLAATVPIAAEAKPAAVLFRQIIGTAPRLPRVVGAVQATAARARLLASGLGQILVN